MIQTIKNKLILDKAFIKSVFAIAVPIALQNMISFGVNVADSVMLGSLGDIAISSANLGTQPFSILMAICFGFSSGGGVLIAQFWGKKDIESIKKVMRMSMQLVFLVSTIITLLCLLFPRQIMSIFTTEEDVITTAVSYLSLVAFSYIPFALSNNYMMSLRAVEQVFLSTGIYIVSFFVNVFFNYTFIFGAFGAPALGVRGAAVGTILARCSELLLVIIYSYFVEKRVKFKIHYCFKLDFSLVRQYIKHSMPVVGNEILWGIGFSLTTAIIGRIGSVFVAANSIAGILNQLAFVSIIGVANAAAVLTGKTIGEGNIPKAKKIANSMLLFSFMVGIWNCILILLLRYPFLSFYNITQETYDAAVSITAVMAVIQLVLCIDVTCIVGILRGGGDTRYSFMVDCGALWLIGLPAGVISGLILGVPVPFVYICLKLDTPIKAILSLFRIRSGKWIRNVTD